MLISMILSGCITFWHAGLSRFHYDESLQDRMDFWAFIIFIAAYFVFQLLYIYLTYAQVRHLAFQMSCRAVARRVPYEIVNVRYCTSSVALRLPYDIVNFRYCTSSEVMDDMSMNNIEQNGTEHIFYFQLKHKQLMSDIPKYTYRNG